MSLVTDVKDQLSTAITLADSYRKVTYVLCHVFTCAYVALHVELPFYVQSMRSWSSAAAEIPAALWLTLMLEEGAA